jgi:hypothetical protein
MLTEICRAQIPFSTRERWDASEPPIGGPHVAKSQIQEAF